MKLVMFYSLVQLVNVLSPYEVLVVSMYAVVHYRLLR